MAEPPSWSGLDRAFERAVAPLRHEAGPLVVLFSGGVDSGLLAWELRDRPRVSLFTVGLPGSGDLEHARTAAPSIGLPWEAATLSEGDLLEVVAGCGSELDSLPPRRASVFIGLAAAFARAPGPTLVCGQGADELFLGYAHFRGLSTDAAAARSASDLERLLVDDWPRTLRLAARWHRTVLAPFLEPAFVAAAVAVPIESRLPTAGAKSLFRAWARSRGLPAGLAERPKRALQYGTGVDRWLRLRGGHAVS